MKYKLLMVSMVMFLVLLGVSSCSSGDENNPVKGKVQFYVEHSLMFTRAVDMAALSNTDNYIIDIYDAEGNNLMSKALGEIEESTVELEEGTYKLVAHYGESKPASQSVLMMKGERTFSVEAGKVSEVGVTCTPVSAKVMVDFGEKMETYFSDYYVTYSTKALNEEGTAAIWSRTNTDPWYLLVENDETVKATIHVTRKSDGKSTTVERQHNLSAGKAWTLSIEAKEEEQPSGDATFTITIDDTTNDKEETIIVPNNWWM